MQLLRYPQKKKSLVSQAHLITVHKMNLGSGSSTTQWPLTPRTFSSKILASPSLRCPFRNAAIRMQTTFCLSETWEHTVKIKILTFAILVISSKFHDDQVKRKASLQIIRRRCTTSLRASIFEAQRVTCLTYLYTWLKYPETRN